MILDIIARVRTLHPGNPSKQRKALERWAELVRANDPEVAEEIFDAPLQGMPVRADVAPVETDDDMRRAREAWL